MRVRIRRMKQKIDRCVAPEQETGDRGTKPLIPRRVSIARALVNRPPMLLTVDKPTVLLDSDRAFHTTRIEYLKRPV